MRAVRRCQGKNLLEMGILHLNKCRIPISSKKVKKIKGFYNLAFCVNERSIQNMMDKENLYIRILLWVYERQETGFAWKELGKEFNLNDLQDNWIKKIFLTTSYADRKFIEILRNDQSVTPNVYYYSLNEKGMSAVIDYQELKEARESSRDAKFIAIGSLALATIVGIAQIVVQFCI